MIIYYQSCKKHWQLDVHFIWRQSCFIIPKLLFITLMFCFAEDNTILPVCKIQWRNRTAKKKRIFMILSVVRGSRPGDNLLPPYKLYMFGSISLAIFRKTSKLSHYFYIIKRYVRYNNMCYVIIRMLSASHQK